jgi:hypothetical protein
LNTYVREHVKLNLDGIEKARRLGQKPVTGITSIFYTSQELLAEHAPIAAPLGPRLHAINTKAVADAVQEQAGIIQANYIFDPEIHRNWRAKHPEMDPDGWIMEAGPVRWMDIQARFEHLAPGGAFHPSTTVNCPGCFSATPMRDLFRAGNAPDSPGLGLCCDCTTEAVLIEVLVRNPDTAPCEFLCDNPDALKHFLLARLGQLYPDRAALGLPNLPHMDL